MPDNWFELRSINREKLIPYDQSAFEAQILTHVTNRMDKLGHLNVSFGSRYKSSEILGIDFHLDSEKFTKIASILETQTRHPIITFHGTTSLKNIESILEKGYQLPGKEGLKATHGAAYGLGVYSSPHFDKAMYYTTPDPSGMVYVLINLTFLGKFNLIAPQDYAAANPRNGTYHGGIHTRIVSGLEQLVSANPDFVVPVAVMTIKSS